MCGKHTSLQQRDVSCSCKSKCERKKKMGDEEQSELGAML
jgi:hypothetical protein